MSKQVLVDGQRMNLDEYLGKVRPSSKKGNGPVYEEDLQSEESLEAVEESVPLEEMKLNKMKVSELKEVAKDHNLEVDKLTKAEIITLLEDIRYSEL